MRTPALFLSLAFVAPVLISGCTDDGGDGGADETSSTSSGDGDGDATTSTGDGDGDPTTTGDGDGDPTTGDGDGDPTTGDGDGDPTTGDGDGDPTTGDGDCDTVRISTNLGDLVVELDPVEAPNTVANFKAYIDAGFYEGLIFHRVINNFMIQGGGLQPGMIPAEGQMPPINLEISGLTHVNGAISMARTNDPNSATSQFFICDGPQDFLDGQYAAFGVLSEGFDVLDTISSVQTTSVPPFDDVPVEDVVIASVTYDCG